MPRPGPRPYECVRRAWHSDRHQPIRGSVIQEIFRVANEVHCSATRKNREWQEKLPIVVLKAEEIMYSKANSEAEYSDLKTLWDRVNDAINTIIRRDESTETGEQLLQPCIEAALHLGCTPRRTSRSQRNDSPRHYLRTEPLENTSVSVPNDTSNSKLYGTHKTINPLMLNYPQSQTISPLNPLNPCLKGDNHTFQHRTSNSVKNFPVLAKNESQASPWSVYPLYYINNNPIQTDELKLCSSEPLISSTHFDASNFIFPSNHESSSSRVQGAECDLTLRLGSLVENADISTLEEKKFKSRLNR